MGNYVLVGGGFLGKYIVSNILQKEGDSVTVIDKASPDSFYSHPQIKNFKNDKRLTYFWQSAGDYVSLLQKSVIQNADGVIFTMAIADVPYAEKSPLDTFNTNVINTLQFLELCRAVGFTGRVIVMSSESVYGHQPEDKLPIDETCLPNPANIYGASKLCQEIVAKVYHSAYNLRVTILRSATMYGPFGRTKQAIPVFAQQILKDEPVTLMGDGSQTRDFISVTDVADAAVKAVTAPQEQKIEGEVFNIGTGREVSMIGLVNAMKMSLRKPSDEFDKFGVKKEGYVPIKSIPWRPGEQGLRVVLETKKAREQLQWEPHADLREGLCGMIAWIAADVIKYEPDELEIVNQLLYPNRYTIDPKSLPKKIGETMTMTDEEYAEYKRKQVEKLAIAGEKARSKE